VLRAPPYAVGALSDRRRYPRVQADITCRPAGNELFHHKRNTQDISLGGVRVYSDEDFPVGSRLDLDVLITGEEPVRCWAIVVWRSEIGAGGPAKFDVGLRFTDMAPSDIQRLAGVLVRAG
jgi:c-di-GMP-binding flagellar brake protein YcgR